MANEVALYYDSSLCSACKGCQVQCKQWNNLPSAMGLNANTFTGTYQSKWDLDGDTRLLMEYREEAAEGFDVEWAFTRRACFHCTDAACVDVCPTGALSHLENGTVKVDFDLCIGCKYCTAACPFSVPKYREHQGYMNKCTLCDDRQAQGREPACVQTCPAEALFFGDRAEMIAKGEARVEELKAMGYDKAELYGVTEMGGMHSLMLAKYGFEAHGLIRNPKRSAGTDALGWLKPVVGVGAAAVVGGLGLSFVMNSGYKRDELTLEDSLAVDSLGNPIDKKEA